MAVAGTRVAASWRSDRTTRPEAGLGWGDDAGFAPRPRWSCSRISWTLIARAYSQRLLRANTPLESTPVQAASSAGGVWRRGWDQVIGLAQHDAALP